MLQLLHDVIYFHSYLLKVVLSASPARKHGKMMCAYMCIANVQPASGYETLVSTSNGNRKRRGAGGGARKNYSIYQEFSS